MQTRTSTHLHIFLLGMMGSGKTYWAQKIAESKNMDWIDLDAQVEKAAFLTIREIFDTNGEAHFRKMERDVLRKLSEVNNLIISTGGGTPCFYDNMNWMNNHGITIWLDETPNVLAERLKREKMQRPLIKNLDDKEIIHFLRNKIAERSAYYSQAKFHLHGHITEENFTDILNIEINE